MSWANGFYRGTSAAHILDIRIDLGSGSLGVVSCDLYQSAAEAGFLFLNTLRATDVVVGAGDHLEVELTVHPGQVGRARLTLDRSAGVRSATLNWLGPGDGPQGPILMQVEHQTPLFRQFVCEVDRDEQVPQPGEAQVFSASPPRTVSWRECFQAAGIGMLPSTGDSLFETAASWSRAELHAATHDPTFFTQLQDGVTARVYLLLVRRLRGESSTAGLMFDPEHRRGAAVFYDTIAAVYPTDPELQASYVRAVVHELGHTLNLPHAFEAAGLAEGGAASLTFMNYPHRYGGLGDMLPGVFADDPRSSVRRYWSNFDYRFARSELMELRHGRLFDILMGGSAYRGELPESRLLPVAPGATPGRGAAGRLQFEVRLQPERPAHLFAFGEPVHVELKLRVVSGAAEVDHPLDPATHAVEFHIRRPDKTEVVFEPPLVLTSLSPPQVLDPDRPALYGDVCLSYSRHGFTFSHPGRYMIQALYRHDDGVLVSNQLPLFVRYPTEDEERYVVPTFEDEVATYFILRGGPHLKSANALLDELAAVFPTHPLARYHNALKALTSASGFRLPALRSGPARRRTELSVPASADPTLFAKALGTSPAKPLRKHLSAEELPFSNIFFEQLVRLAVSAFEKDSRAHGKQLHNLAKAELLEGREIPVARVLPTEAQAFWTGEG